MNFTLTSNELNFRMSTAVAYRYGMNNQMFSYVQISKALLELEDLYTREELEFMCQSDNIDSLHEAVSSILS